MLCNDYCHKGILFSDDAICRTNMPPSDDSKEKSDQMAHPRNAPGGNSSVIGPKIGMNVFHHFNFSGLLTPVYRNSHDVFVI